MAYFPNGTSFAIWQEENCSDCLNYRDNGTGSFGCAITDAHVITRTHDRICRRLPAFRALDQFIPDEGPDAFQCKMRLTHEIMEAEAKAEQLRLDRARYEAAMAETRRRVA